MNARTHLRSAIDLFRTQKIRFLLTVSGIVVGVASLLVMASLLSVGREVLQRTTTEVTGQDVITVSNDWRAIHENPDAVALTDDDVAALRQARSLPDDRRVAAEYGPDQRKAQFGEQTFEPFVMGIPPDTLDLRHLEVAEGRAFLTEEYDQRRRVVLVGAKVLDGDLDPGDTLRIEGVPYVVVGVLAEKAEMGPGGAWSWNNRLLLPYTTYQLQFDPSGRPRNIVVRVRPPVTYEGLIRDYVLAARDVVDAVLSEGRTVKTWEYEGASAESSTERVVFQTIQALLYLTTVFSMVVGGINIMNIMLVTVTERTREIGTRRALGASRADILRQFLAETVMVALVGAAIGVVCGIGLVAVGSVAMNQVTEWTFRIVPWSLVVGVLFSTGIGLVFGMYPAWRASRLDPVEALRHD